MNIDTSELAGKSFECLENCAMCCLCQPELNEEELRAFKKANLADSLTREHIQGYVADEQIAIRLQGESGACHFLIDRRCTIYNMRPTFCRRFPVHVHALHRIQLNADLSCRGITDGGNTLEKFGADILASIPKKLMDDVQEEVEARLRSFKKICLDKQIYQAPERLRSVADCIIPLLTKNDGIGGLLAFANTETKIGEIPDDKIVGLVLASEPPADLEEMASEANYAQFDLENPSWLPVYVDERLRWNTFRSGEGKIHWMGLHENGAIETVNSFEIGDIKLLPTDQGARKTFADYARLLISRDHFLGHAYQVCADQKFDCDLMNIYLGIMATTLLDLWWRASLIGLVNEKSKLNSSLAKEGIRAFDMDCLDMPTMGTFF
jgi:Fe-S-cluster containining protein